MNLRNIYRSLMEKAEIQEEYETKDWTIEGYYGDFTQLYKCKHCRYPVRASTMQAAAEQHKPECNPRKEME